jgi:hypothetical protein
LHFFIDPLAIFYSFIKIDGAVFVAFSLKQNIMTNTKWELVVILLLSGIFFVSCSTTKTVASLDDNDSQEMVNNKDFIFVADRVNPLRGRSRQLTSEYDVRVKNDSLTSYLPYFGRAHSAPMDPSKGGIQFTSTDFSYNVSENKGWNVVIKPNDNNDVQEMTFTIFGNGSATLNVSSLQRDPITFNGYVKRNTE